MSKNKKQHFVARFYLKFFSKNGKSINIFNIESKKTIIDASLKNQCYGDYFYGEDLKLEGFLGTVESKAAAVLREMVRASTIPRIPSPDFVNLLTYIVTQNYRTEKSVIINDIQKANLNDYLKRHKSHVPIGINDNKSRLAVSGSDSPHNNVITSYLIAPGAFDLRWKVISIDPTFGQFITSDNPVIFTNPLLDGKVPGGTTGIRSRGLIIAMPISPVKILILFDSFAYSIGSKCCPVESMPSHDCSCYFNNLQVISALKNLYFNDADRFDFQLYKKALVIRNTEDTNVKVVSERSTKNGSREIIRISSVGVKFNKLPFFIRIKKRAKAWLATADKRERPSNALCRPSVACDFYEQLTMQLMFGKITLQEFNDIIQNPNELFKMHYYN